MAELSHVHREPPQGLYGDKAVKENDFGYSWVPKLDDTQDASVLNMIDNMFEKKLKGLVVIAQNPACSLPNSNKVRQAMTNLDWLVHVNFFDNETASFWKGPGVSTKKIKTEVFLLPASASIEKEGSQTNSGRWVQWRYKGGASPGDAISTGDIVYRIVSKVKDLYKKQGGTFPDPILNLEWAYADAKGRFDPLKMAKTVNGYRTTGLPRSFPMPTTHSTCVPSAGCSITTPAP